MKKYSRPLLMFVLLAGLLSGCMGQVDRQWLKTPGWSRAALQGNTMADDPVMMAIDDQGGIYLFEMRAENDLVYPYVIALDPQGQTVGEYKVEITVTQPHEPRIIWDGSRLNMFWISQGELYMAQMDRSGEQQGRPTQISRSIEVGNYNVAMRPGQGLAVWFSGPRSKPGLYALPANSLTGEPVQIDPVGVRPSLEFDDDGTLHALWAHYPTGYADTVLIYASYAGGDVQPGQERALLVPQVNISTSLGGPWLGLDHQRVYIFYTITILTGLEARSVRTRYGSFPIGSPPETLVDQLLYMPTDYTLTYQPAADTELQARNWVPLDDPDLSMSSGLIQIAANPVPASELAIAFHSQVEHQFRKTVGQVSVAYFKEGSPLAYQLLSFSLPNSVKPSLMQDAQNNLYITWVEGGELPGYQVYFASTAPGIAQTYGQLSGEDFVRLASEAGFGLLSGIILAPLATFIWLVVPLIVLGITTFIRRGRGDWQTYGTLVSLALCVLAFWAVKLGSLPGIFTYTPFSAWFPGIPAGLGLVLRVLVPVLIGIVALLVAWRFGFRSDARTPLYFVLIYAAVDGVLTMAIYGVLVYASL